MQTQDRLESWKAISAHFNRTVRTVQRWERDLGLPVHRIPGRKRDMVYAVAGELDQWLRTREGARALAEPEEHDSGEHASIANGSGHSSIDGRPLDANQPDAIAHLSTLPVSATGRDAGVEANASRSGGRRRRYIAAAVVFFVLGGGAALALRSPLRSLMVRLKAAQPHDWKVTPQQLEVYDAQGRLLWARPFSDRLYPPTYERSRRVRELPLVAIEDLDGDGRKEVMFVTRFESPRADNSVFYCLNYDGTERFTYAHRTGVRFGKLDYNPPFNPRGLVVTRDPDGRGKVWLSVLQEPEFPEVLLKLDDKGRVLSEFWHGGHLHALAEGSYRGKRVMFAGYVENDKRRSSMAVLDYYNATGFAPVEDPYYECSSCPAGRPLEFFIFPRSELSQEVNSLNYVEELFTGGNGIQVATRQTQPYHLPSGNAGGLFYKFDVNLELSDAFHDASYPEVHAELEANGVLKHRYSRAEEIEAFPVLKWDGKKFLPIPAPAGFLASRTEQNVHRPARGTRTQAQGTPGTAPRESSPAAIPTRPQP